MGLFVSIFVLILVVLIAGKIQNDRKIKKQKIEGDNSKIQHKKQEYLCTNPEKKLFYSLQKCLTSEHMIHCQTSFVSLVRPLEWKNISKATNKRVDFVITDRSSKVLAVIELDDSTHNIRKNAERDKYKNEALDGHHPLIRIQTQDFYDPEFIGKLLKEKANINNKFSAQRHHGYKTLETA